MKSWKAGGALALGILGLVLAGTVRLPARAEADPAWLSDYAAAQSAARQTGKPIFLVFR